MFDAGATTPVWADMRWEHAMIRPLGGDEGVCVRVRSETLNRLSQPFHDTVWTNAIGHDTYRRRETQILDHGPFRWTAEAKRVSLLAGVGMEFC